MLQGVLMTGNALIIFTKYPEPGTCKTRIARALGNDFAVELCMNMMLDTLAVADRSDADTVICWTSEKRKISDGIFAGRNYRFIEQQGGDIGERMYMAFSGVFSLGYSRAVLVGSDIPDLTPEIILNAFAALDLHDCAFGPSSDGGYYLSAFREQAIDRVYFSDINWSTPEVFRKTRELILEHGIRMARLEILNDMDTPGDLINFTERHGSSCGSNTAGFLHEWRQRLHEASGH